MGRDPLLRREVTAHRPCRVGGADDGPGRQRRIAVTRVHPPAGEHVHVRRERHGGGAQGQENLWTRAPGSHQDDRRGGDRRAGDPGHAAPNGPTTSG